MAQAEVSEQGMEAESPPIRTPSRRWTIWIVLIVLLMILAAVQVCSRWSIRGLLPPLIDESGRSQLDANYSPWEVAFPSIQLDIPRLATAASRGEEDWTTGNPPPTGAFTPLPSATIQSPTTTPTPTVRPTVVSNSGGGSTGGGTTAGTSTSEPGTPPSPPTSTPISGVTDGGSSGSGVSCGSACSSDADCAGLGPNPVCAGGSCYDSQTCGGGSTAGGSTTGGSTTGGSTTGGSTTGGSTTGGPTPPSGVTSGG